MLGGVQRTHVVMAIALQMFLEGCVHLEPETDRLEGLNRTLERMTADDDLVSHTNLLIGDDL